MPEPTGDAAAVETLQLNDGHSGGPCSASWSKSDVSYQHATAGSDGRICIRQGPTSLMQKAGTNTGDVGFNCLVVTPDGKTALTGDEQYTKAWSLPSCELKGNITRFTLPVRALAVSPDGTQVVSGGDDGFVRVACIANTKTLKQKKLDDYIKSIAWDPEGAYLAVTTAGGHVRILHVEEWKVEVARRVIPKVGNTSTRRLGVAWHPDGGVQLAAPGLEKDVVLLERLNWCPMAYLAGGHDAEVDLVAWSPNGIYLASMDTAGSTCLWMVEKQLRLRKFAPCSQPGSSLAWHPAGNSLLVGGAEGGVGLLQDVVPPREELPCPWAPPDEVLRHADARREGSPTANGLEDSLVDQDLEDEDMEEDNGGLAVQRRRPLLRGQAGAGAAAADASGGLGATSTAGLDDDLLDDAVDIDGRQLEWPGMPSRAARGSGGGGGSRAAAASLPRQQGAIQPGSTPPGVAPVGPAAGARFLAYNEIGLIVSRQVEAHRTVEVAFHDTTKYRYRVPLLTDYYGFTLGALGPRSVLYSAPASGETPAVVLCRQFESWTSNSDWTVALPDKEAPVALAVGSSFAAVATNRQVLRLYTPAGRCAAVLSLGRPVVALAAHDHLLGVVTAGLPSWSSNSQQLQYQVLDTSTQQQLHSGDVPLSPGASLTWCALSDTGVLATVDSRGTLRLRTCEWGGAWVPVLDLAAVKAAVDADAYWPVAVSGEELTCVLTTPAQPQPAVLPRPTLQRVPLLPLVAPADAAPADKESKGLLQGMSLAQLRHQAAAGDDSAELAGAIAAAEFAADVTALRQLQDAVVAGRQARALEAVAGMYLERTIAGALKFANASHLPALAERITAIQEQRAAWQLAQEDEQQQQQQQEEDGTQEQHGYLDFTTAGMEEEEDVIEGEEAAAGAAGGSGRGEQWAAQLRAAAGDDTEEEEEGAAAAGGAADAPGSSHPLKDVGNRTAAGAGGSRMKAAAAAQKPVAAIFNRHGSTGSKNASKGSGGIGAVAGAKRRPDAALQGAPAGGAKGNPFARVKR